MNVEENVEVVSIPYKDHAPVKDEGKPKTNDNKVEKKERVYHKINMKTKPVKSSTNKALNMI